MKVLSYNLLFLFQIKIIMTKAKKRLLVILGILITIVVIGIFTFNGIVAGIATSKVDDFLKKNPVKNYHITYKRVGYNLVNQSVKLVGVSLIPTDTYFDSLSATGYSFTVPEVYLGKLVITGIDQKNALMNKAVNLNKIRIKNLEVKLWKIDGKVKKATRKSANPLPDSIRIKGLTSLSIHQLIIEKSKVELINRKSKKKTVSTDEISAKLSDIRLISTGHNNGYFKPVIADATIQIDNNVFYTPDNLYKIVVKRATINLLDKEVFINTLQYQPLYSKKDFVKHIKFQKERYDFVLKRIKLSLPDVKALINNNKLTIPFVEISNSSFNIYRDKRVPFDHNKRPLLPNQAIKKMALQININTLTVKNSTFKYEEVTDRSSQPLIVSFSDLSVDITNLSNLKNRSYQKSKMKIALKGKLMEIAPFDMQLIFPLKARNDTFVFSGAVYGRVPLKAFNKATFPAAGINFEKGSLNKLTFKGGANPYHSKGTLTLLYNDVKLDVVRKNKKQSSKFLSWGATTVIHKDNPVPGKPVKTAIMASDRNPEKGLGNYLWKTIFSGLKGTFIGGKKSFVQPEKTHSNTTKKKRNKRKH